MRMSTAIEEYLNDLRAARRSTATITSYKSDLLLLLSLARGTEADSLLAFTPELVRRYFLEQSRRDLKQTTMHKRRAAIGGFARWCLMRRFVADDPMATTPKIKRPKRLPRPYSDEAREALLGLPLTGNETVIRGLLYFAGLRVSEVCNARVPDVRLGDNDTEGVLVVRNGKGNTDRAVPLVPDLWHLLQDHLLATANLVDAYGHDGGPHLLLRPMGARLKASLSGSPYTSRMVQRMVRRWGVAVRAEMFRRLGFDPFQGEKFTPHKFRHSFCTDLLADGADIREVQEAAGHKDISTTVGYVELNAQRLRTAVNRLSRREKVIGAGSLPQPPTPSAGTGGVVQRTESEGEMGRRAGEGL